MTDINTIDIEVYYDKDYTLKKLTNEEFLNSPLFTPLMICVQRNHEPPTVIDCGLPPVDYREIAVELKRLEVDKLPMIGHNLRFDAAILAWKFGIVPPRYIDTMFMARAELAPYTGSVALGHIADALLLPVRKGDTVERAKGKHRGYFQPSEWAEYVRYCCDDVAATRLVYDALHEAFSEIEMDRMDLTTRMYVEPTLELAGAILHAMLEGDKHNMKVTLNKLGVTVEQLRSDAKFAECLQNLGMPVPYKTSPRTGKRAFAFAKTDPVMQQMLNSQNPKVKSLAEARLSAKSSIRQSRAQRFLGIHERMGRLPVPLVYYGAHTGRYAGTDGINMQNLNRGSGLRECIVAPEGTVLMGADQAQIEARVNACWSGQGDLVKDFDAGVDVYSKLATRIYGYECSKATPNERFVGKMGILGLGYGMGAQRFGDSLQQASVEFDAGFPQEVVDTYRKQFPKIKRNWYRGNDMLKAMAKGYTHQWGPLVCEGSSVGGKVHLPNGLMLHYPELYQDGQGEFWFKHYVRGAKTPDWRRIYGPMLVENCCQAMANLIVCDQMVQLDRHLKLYGVKTAMQVHDEIIFAVPDQHISAVTEIVMETMQRAPDWMPDLPLEVEVGVGGSYAAIK